jgi:hypothetical protein
LDSVGRETVSADPDLRPESVVLVLQGSAPEAHPGIIDGYERLRRQGAVSEISVFPVFGPQGVVRGDIFWDAVIQQANDQEASLVVFQSYHSRALPDPRPAMRRLHRLRSHPFLVSTLADPFMNAYLGRPSIPRSFLQAAEESDLVTLTSMGALVKKVSEYTAAPIMLLPLSACQVRFGSAEGMLSDQEKAYDVVFVGSRNSSRNPLRPYHWFGKRRSRLVDNLSKRYGKRFAVYGSGWDHLPSACGCVPFVQQANAVCSARLVVGGIPFSRERYYASNRPFIQMTSGVPIVDVHVPGVETLLQDRVHWLLSAEAKLMETVEEVLAWTPDARAAMGRAAAKYVLSRHTQAHRVATLVENVRRLRAWRDAKTPVRPHMPFFHDDVDMSTEMPHATRNWPEPTKTIVGQERCT